MISFNSARRAWYRSTIALRFSFFAILLCLAIRPSPAGTDAGRGRLDADGVDRLDRLGAERQAYVPALAGQPVALALDVGVEAPGRTPVRVGDVVAEARLGAGQLAVGGQGVTCLSSRRLHLKMETIVIY